MTWGKLFPLAAWKNALAGRLLISGKKVICSKLYLFLLDFRGRLNQVNPSSYAQVMAKMVKLHLGTWELVWLTHFLFEMPPELDLDEGFFVVGFEHQHGESNDKEVSSDPFNIYDLLDKRTKEVRTTDTSTSIPYPPGFTPANDIPACNNQDIPEANLFSTPTSWIPRLGSLQKSWNSFTLDDSNGMIRFKKKLQMLKKEIRAWTLDFKRHQVGLSKDLKSKLCDIDKVLDQGGVTDDILLSRLEVLKQLHDVQSSNNRDIMQKAKIRWAIEGDENSKYFHAIINKKRANLSVKGIMVDGDWIVEPILVKQEFRSHFTDRFQDPGFYTR
ncbi:hypothetical protein Tco_0490904 [Tanacetum coccineum]